MPVVVIFAVYCAWEGSQWLFPALALDPLPFACMSAVGFGAISLVASRWRRHGQPARAGDGLGLYGVFALGVPSMLLSVAQHYVSSALAVASLSAVPVVVVVAGRIVSTTDEGAGDALLPATAGLAGALLVLPVGLPASTNGWIGLGLDVLAMLSAGIFAVFAHRAAAGESLGSTVFTVGRSNAIVFAAFALALWLARIPSLQTLTLPGAGVLLTTLAAAAVAALAAVMLLRAMHPLGFASRFLVVPLLGVLEAYAVLRPTLSTRTLIGVALMATASLLLIRSSPASVASVVPERS